jgi:hypothetical protein
LRKVKDRDGHVSIARPRHTPQGIGMQLCHLDWCCLPSNDKKLPVDGELK